MGCEFFLYYQGEEADVERKDFFSDIIFDNRLRGVFTPRYELLKRYGVNYEFSIILDDDLRMTKATSYEHGIGEIRKNPKIGAVSLAQYKKTSSRFELAKRGMRFSILGGLILPKKSVCLILDYFKDKEKDYSEDDAFWLIPYIKGYDLYLDSTSYALHGGKEKDENGQHTGFLKSWLEMPFVPTLEEWTTLSEIKKEDKTALKIKGLAGVNEKGLAERERCRKALGFD